MFKLSEKQKKTNVKKNLMIVFQTCLLLNLKISILQSDPLRMQNFKENKKNVNILEKRNLSLTSPSW